MSQGRPKDVVVATVVPRWLWLGFFSEACSSEFQVVVGVVCMGCLVCSIFARVLFDVLVVGRFGWQVAPRLACFVPPNPRYSDC